MLDAGTYRIHFREGNFRASIEEIEALQPSRLFVLCDENTARHCYPLLRDLLGDHQLISIPAGEPAKSLESCQIVWDVLTQAKADRKALLLNLGGGMIGDLGGFAASSYKRGIRFVQMPTTLLSQVDASVGGKTGVNFRHYKNQLGAFSNPEAVFIHQDFFATLSGDELRSGYAEMLKHALIADPQAWAELSAQPGLPKNVFDLLPRSVGIKLRIVQEDPFEQNIRKSLNFGHTVGHALESFFFDSDHPLKHGEAVAIGMICEAFLSTEKGYLSPADRDQISTCIAGVYPKKAISSEHYDRLLNLMGQDKKNLQGAISFTLLEGIGSFRIDERADEEQIRAALDYYTHC